jgi:hypothetical protein
MGRVPDPQRITLQLDVDTGGQPIGNIGVGRKTILDEPGLMIELVPDDEAGYGFGLAEVATVAITVGAGVTSELVADSVKAAVKAIIRRARGTSSETDGSKEALTRLIETERSHVPDRPSASDRSEPQNVRGSDDNGRPRPPIPPSVQ